jgi:hypothetical protein
VHDVIQTHRRRVVELMQEWTRLKRDADAGDVSLAMVVDAELFRLDSVIRWLDAADSRLRRSTAEAGPPRESGLPSPAAAQKQGVGARR